MPGLFIGVSFCFFLAEDCALFTGLIRFGLARPGPISSTVISSSFSSTTFIYGSTRSCLWPIEVLVKSADTVIKYSPILFFSFCFAWLSFLGESALAGMAGLRLRIWSATEKSYKVIIRKKYLAKYLCKLEI